MLTAIAVVPGSAAAAPRPSLHRVQVQVDQLNREAGDAAERYNDARVELADADRRLTVVRHRLSAQQDTVEEMQSSVGQLAAASYKSGGVDSTLQILLADDPESFLQSATALSQLGRHQSETLARVVAARQKLASVRLAVTQERSRSAAIDKQVAAEKASVEEKLAKARALLGTLRADQRARLDAARKAAAARGRAVASRSRSGDIPGIEGSGGGNDGGGGDSGNSGGGGNGGNGEGGGGNGDGAGGGGNGGAGNGGGGNGDGGGGGNGGGGNGDGGGGNGGGGGGGGGGGNDGGGNGGGGGPDQGDNGRSSGRAETAVKTAYAQLGDPYRYGAAGPGSFDCSGLTMFAWNAAGVSLPHSSSAQYSAASRVSTSNLAPGDLVFYYSPISHVGIYIGGGRIIHAPHPGRSVEIVGLHSMPLVGAARP